MGDFRSLFDREPAEEPHDNEIGQSRVDCAQLVQRNRQVEELDVEWRCDRDVIRERYFPPSAAALEGCKPPGMVHQDATHQASGDREELDAVLPAYAAEIYETHVGLMDESRRCQRVIAAFGPEAPARDTPKICVHDLH